MPDDSFRNSPRSRFRAAMVLAVLADAVQIVVFPLFAEGALSPLDDILDLIVAVALFRLLGWHWEFLPSSIAKLVPGVDLVPMEELLRKIDQLASSPTVIKDASGKPETSQSLYADARFSQIDERRARKASDADHLLIQVQDRCGR